MMKAMEEFYSAELSEPRDPFSMPAIDRGKLRDSEDFETVEEALAAGAEEIRFRYFTDYAKHLGNSVEDDAIRAAYYRCIQYLAEKTAADIIKAYKKFLSDRAGDYYSSIAVKARDFYETASKEKSGHVAANAEISGRGVELNLPEVKSSDKLVEVMKVDVIKGKIIAGIPACEFFQRKVKASSRSVIVTGLFGSETEEERFFYDISEAADAFVNSFSLSAQAVAGGIWELILAKVRDFLAGVRLELDKRL